MKEIGKLIELLNEYEKNRIEKINSEGKLFVKLSFKPYTEEALTNKAYRNCRLEICSKYYGFIKWLVENDKIDLGLYREYMLNLGEDFSVESNIIMNLSIAIDPIGYLNYILK